MRTQNSKHLINACAEIAFYFLGCPESWVMAPVGGPFVPPKRQRVSANKGIYHVEVFSEFADYKCISCAKLSKRTFRGQHSQSAQNASSSAQK
jgi:hypothetical protein